MGVTATTKSRASTQSSATVETKKGKILNSYVDKNGNVTGGDVLIQGETTAMVNLSNASGNKFRVGDNVLVNFPRGQPLAGQIIGFSGSASSASAQASTPSSDGTTTTSPPDVTTIPFVLAGPDETAPGSYVESGGANVVLTYANPGTVAGNVNGQVTVTAQPTLAVTNLPDPTNVSLINNTVLDLYDSSFNPLGMYRLDGSVSPRVWRRRDAGTGGTGGGSGSGATQVVTTPTPYYRMQSQYNAVNRIPVASDFTGLESYTYNANGPDGSLRFETVGLALDAYWQMGLSNTTAAAVTVNWSLPYVDNFAAGDFAGTSLFSISSSGPGGSGQFTIPANSSGILHLYYANAQNGVYNTSNQGTFWFQMDALLTAGVVFEDALTGITPNTILIGDATTTKPGLVEVHANPASGHPIVYLSSEVDTLIGTEATTRGNADTTLQTNITNEATTRGNNDTTLQTNINTEITNRGNADTALQANITSEANARIAADALSLKIANSLSDVASITAARSNLGLVSVGGQMMAFSATTASVTLATGSLSLILLDVTWVSVGQTVRLDNGANFAYFDVSNINTSTKTLTVTWRNGEGGAASGTVFAAASLCRALRTFKTSLWNYPTPATGGDEAYDWFPKCAGQQINYILIEYQLGVDVTADEGSTATTIRFEASAGSVSFSATVVTGTLTLAASSGAGYQTVSPSPLASTDKMNGALNSGMKVRPNTLSVGTGAKNLTVGALFGF